MADIWKLPKTDKGLQACQIASKRDPRVAANSDPLTA